MEPMEASRRSEILLHGRRLVHNLYLGVSPPPACKARREEGLPSFLHPPKAEKKEERCGLASIAELPPSRPQDLRSEFLPSYPPSLNWLLPTSSALYLLCGSVPTYRLRH